MAGTADRGDTLSGAKPAVREAVEYIVTVGQLPDARSLVLQT
ncbi:hypothetical protein P1P68_29300 [Streptomyces scabiei]|nr:hypothetical protein [Streptomyces scabiei]MDW8808779.1 hypothetical protein [Streptomyces scabiei]